MTAQDLDAWIEANGVQAISCKRYAGSWHAVAVVDGETVSAQADTPSSALSMLLEAVADLASSDELPNLDAPFPRSGG